MMFINFNFSMRGAFSLAFFILSLGLLERVVAFDLSRKDNVRCRPHTTPQLP